MPSLSSARGRIETVAAVYRSGAVSVAPLIMSARCALMMVAGLQATHQRPP